MVNLIKKLFGPPKLRQCLCGGAIYWHKGRNLRGVVSKWGVRSVMGVGLLSTVALGIGRMILS